MCAHINVVENCLIVRGIQYAQTDSGRRHYKTDLDHDVDDICSAKIYA